MSRVEWTESYYSCPTSYVPHMETELWKFIVFVVSSKATHLQEPTYSAYSSLRPLSQESEKGYAHMNHDHFRYITPHKHYVPLRGEKIKCSIWAEMCSFARFSLLVDWMTVPPRCLAPSLPLAVFHVSYYDPLTHFLYFYFTFVMFLSSFLPYTYITQSS